MGLLLNGHLPRDDYREFLELVLVFLGFPLINYQFRKPGAMSHARWMSKAIYTLKIYIFRKEFNLTAKEQKGLRDVCLFIVIVYVKPWFFLMIPQKAPNQDLELLKNMENFKLIHAAMAKNTIAKMLNHLW